MDATAILDRLTELGVKTTVQDGRLRLTPASRIPADLVEAIRTHKQALMLAVRPPEALRRALTQKGEEITTMRRRLAAPCNADDQEYQRWCQDQIGCLTSHVDEIRRYLREGGTLSLPPCCKDKDFLCLIAMRKFDGCLMLPSECEFAMRRDDGKA